MKPHATIVQILGAIGSILFNFSAYIASDIQLLTEVPRVQNLMTPIVLDGVKCRNTEDSLGQCRHLPVVEGCTHSDDAGANCTIIIGTVGSINSKQHSENFIINEIFLSPECDDGDIRLVPTTGDAENEGRIDYCSGRRWFPVCYDSWDTNDAKVVCRQMGFNVESKFNNKIIIFRGKLFNTKVYCIQMEVC